MENMLVKLAKVYTNDLMTQIYFMELLKELIAEIGGNYNE